MEEDLNLIIEMSKESMKNSIDYLEKKLLNIRAGKANPNMLSNVTVDYYGAKTPLAQMANINTPDAKTLLIQPWDKTALEEIEKAIEMANIGFNPMNNGDNIIISVPALTEERRIQLVKQVKSEIEDAKISVRNARKDANNKIIEGNPDRIKTVTDHWKFTKNASSKSPNWYLTEIISK